MNMTVWRRVATLTALIVAVAGCGSGAGGGGGSASSGGDFVIGVTAAATGPNAGLGEGEFNAARLVADEVNSAGGINGRQIKLITEDDQGLPDKGVSITQRFITQKVDAILGSANSGVALAAGPIAEQAGILYVAPMPANPNITVDAQGNARKWIFRVAQSDTANAQFLGDYAFAHYQRVALMSDTTGYGAGGRQALKSYLGTIGKSLVADEQYATGAPDVTAQLKKIADSNAALVIIWGISTDAATILRGMVSTGMHADSLGMPGLGGTVVCELAGSAAVGLQHLDGWDPTKPEAQKVNKLWQAKYHKPLDNYFGASSYDGMQLLVKALRAGGNDREKARAALESTSNYVGALGKTGTGISFSSTNHDGLSKGGIVVKRVVDTSCARKVVG